MQPATERFTPPDRMRLGRQDQERRLKGVLGQVPIADDTPAHGPNHLGMPPEQRGERLLVVMPDESFQQLPIRRTGAVVIGRDMADVPKQLARLKAFHDCDSRWGR